LIVLRFKLVRELIEAAQTLKACIGECPHGHQGTCKKRDEDDFTSRSLFSKKGENGMFEASHEEVRAAFNVVAGYTTD
jgi:hypothetical protein